MDDVEFRCQTVNRGSRTVGNETQLSQRQTSQGRKKVLLAPAGNFPIFSIPLSSSRKREKRVIIGKIWRSASEMHEF